MLFMAIVKCSQDKKSNTSLSIDYLQRCNEVSQNTTIESSIEGSSECYCQEEDNIISNEHQDEVDINKILTFKPPAGR